MLINRPSERMRRDCAILHKTRPCAVLFLVAINGSVGAKSMLNNRFHAE